MVLTAEQIEELRKILADGATALSVRLTGTDVSEEKLAQLVRDGYIKEGDAPNLVGDAFLVGRLAARQPELASDMDYQMFRDHVRRYPVEFSEAEKEALAFAQQRAGQFIVGLGQRMATEVTPMVVGVNEQLSQEVRQGVRDETARRIADRRAVNEIETRLRQLTEDYGRDWRRIASTESQYAHQTGYLEAVSREHGDDELLAKIPEPTACEHCLRLYLGKDGRPIVMPASWWREQGTNVGLRSTDWKPTMGPVHPWCQCRLQRIPKGMALDDDWDLVPEGEVKKSMALVKSAKPPAGFQPAPGSKRGGYRKKTSDGWEYWYPSDVKAGHQHMDRREVEHKERLEAHRKLVKLGGEYHDPSAGNYVVVLPDPAHPGKVRTQTFDENGFWGHHTYDDLAALVEDTVPYRKPWAPAPGILDKLSRTDTWAEGMARNLVVQVLNSLGYYGQRDDVELINKYVDKHGFKAAAEALRSWSESHKELPGDAREMLRKAADLWDRTVDLIKAGPYIGPKGGKWADPEHTIPWKEKKKKKKKAKKKLAERLAALLATKPGMAALAGAEAFSRTGTTTAGLLTAGAQLLGKSEDPPGTIHTWADGKQYQKQADGSWKPVKGGIRGRKGDKQFRGLEVENVVTAGTPRAFDVLGPHESVSCTRCGAQISTVFVTTKGNFGGDCLATLTGDQSTRKVAKKLHEKIDQYMQRRSVRRVQKLVVEPPDSLINKYRLRAISLTDRSYIDEWTGEARNLDDHTIMFFQPSHAVMVSAVAAHIAETEGMEFDDTALAELAAKKRGRSRKRRLESLGWNVISSGGGEVTYQRLDRKAKVQILVTGDTFKVTSSGEAKGGGEYPDLEAAREAVLSVAENSPNPTPETVKGIARGDVVEWEHLTGSLERVKLKGTVVDIDFKTERGGERGYLLVDIGKGRPRRVSAMEAQKVVQKPAQLEMFKSRKLHGRVKWHGLDISIENRKGSKRHWYDPHAKEHGTTTMLHPYGYIRLTEGVDGDHVDCYLGPTKNARFVYVVHQMKAPKFKEYDEDKCMLNFGSLAEAKRAYLAHYNDRRFYGSASVIPVEKFVDGVRARRYQDTKIVKSKGKQLGLFGGGWEPIPEGKKGGARRRKGKGYEYKYPAPQVAETGRGKKLYVSRQESVNREAAQSQVAAIATVFLNVSGGSERKTFVPVSGQSGLGGRNLGVQITAHEIPKTDKGIERFSRHARKEGLRLMVDSGEFPRFMAERSVAAAKDRGDEPSEKLKTKAAPLDFDKIFASYDRLADAMPPGTLTVVAPDKIADARSTSAIRAKYASHVNDLMDRGVEVIVPLQARNAEELATDWTAAAGHFGEGFVIGVPMAAEPMPMDELLPFVVTLYSSDRYPKLHFLGGSNPGPMGEKTIQIVAAAFFAGRGVDRDRVLELTKTAEAARTALARVKTSNDLITDVADAELWDRAVRWWRDQGVGEVDETEMWPAFYEAHPEEFAPDVDDKEVAFREMAQSLIQFDTSTVNQIVMRGLEHDISGRQVQATSPMTDVPKPSRYPLALDRYILSREHHLERQIPSYASGFHDLFKALKRTPVGTMGNWGDPARAPGSSVVAKPTEGHPATEKERKKNEKKRKQFRKDRKDRIERNRKLFVADAVRGISPAKRVIETYRPVPREEIDVKEDARRNRMTFDKEVARQYEGRFHR